MIQKMFFSTHKSILTLLFCCFLISACERDITVDLPKTESKIVVDSYVEIGLPVYVLLTRSEPYFAPITPGTLINSTEKNAIVTVSDGDTTVQLIELDTILNGVQISGIYVSSSMFGIAGKQYSIKVMSTKGEVLTATSALSIQIPLDSAWYQVSGELDSLGFVWAHLTDPDTLNNCYRWFAKRLGKDVDFIAPFGSSFEDKFINGKSFDFAYNRGSIPNSSAIDDNNNEAGFFKKGDTIVVKFCSIDRGVYEFWRDAETQAGNNGSPFASPSNIKSNVIGGLGCFAAYSATYDTVIAR